ncbi:peptidoglycan D,D-transpeptidase FtsI family protein [Apilactobacillus apinorum]|uniref:Penicillin-binding protein 2 n=1 Tax=Apilactobacillus apinorum TaxID=1218495 RepID=A0ABP9ZIR0_9LACO|nr:penicillin-binding protein 2 [Apilactobacillus apinorum]KOY68872.1 Cell division protein FtsI/penicillin-binding protein 2 [Apilactobacillus apinorum]CAI2671533.1 Cell division protein FtsI/penicillin-binding protein [Apilactobacillus apinorum]
MNSFLQKIFHHRDRGADTKVPFRLNIILTVVGVLFAILVIQLAYLQVVNGNQYKAEVSRSDNSVKLGNVQRGMIYDSTGRVLVGNKAHQAIQYTKGLSVTSATLYKIANKLGEYLSVDYSTLTPRQEAEFYLSNPDNLQKVIDSMTFAKGTSTSDQYIQELAKVIKEKLYSTDKKTRNAAAIFQKMSGSYQLSTTYIKSSGVTTKELAEVGEHLSEMPGVQIGDSWTREYPNGDAIQSIVGTVSSERVGLPSDRINTLLAEGYSRNDSVGQSYLEAKYESTLRGSKSQTLIKSGSLDKAIKQYGGQKGDNLQLTINSEFEKKIQSLVENADRNTGNSTGAYAVVMNPNNGAIIGLAGVSRNPETGKLTPNALGTINSSIVMGSVVKGAMVSGALMDKVITPTNSTLTDKPIITGGIKKASWFNQDGNHDISLDASTALEVSSNSYMMQLAMKEAKFNYYSGAPLTMNPNVFNIMRGYFNQFGLGVLTGIDLPGETKGIQGPGGSANIGKALDLSYGNYDAYTPIQVAQYISTIANGGYRIEPHIVQSIRESNKDGKLGRVKYTVTPTVLNKVDMTDAQRKVVTDGFYKVVHGTNEYRTGITLNTVRPSISAKTGTAQTFYSSGKKGSKPVETVTLSLGSFSPSKNPQVVVVVAIPNLPSNAESNNVNLAEQIYQAYWKYVQSDSGLK